LSPAGSPPNSDLIDSVKPRSRSNSLNERTRSRSNSLSGLSLSDSESGFIEEYLGMGRL
jgi:hypothetical protein